MPAITIRVFEGELTWGQAAELVGHVTEVVVPFVGEGRTIQRLAPGREN